MILLLSSSTWRIVLISVPGATRLLFRASHERWLFMNSPDRRSSQNTRLFMNWPVHCPLNSAHIVSWKTRWGSAPLSLMLWYQGWYRGGTLHIHYTPNTLGHITLQPRLCSGNGGDGIEEGFLGSKPVIIKVLKLCRWNSMNSRFSTAFSLLYTGHQWWMDRVIHKS